MLHVIWTIIKIILLILAVLLGIDVILLLAVLFIPVRYQARGKKGGTAAGITGKAVLDGQSYQHSGKLSGRSSLCEASGIHGFSVRNLLEEEEPFTEFEKEFFTGA